MLHAKTCGDAQRSVTSRVLERSLLSNIKLFSGLSSDELTAIEQACRYRRFSAQEHIIDRDSATTDVFFVVRGRVRVVNYSVSGREISFDDLNEGDCFGELAALDGQPRSTSIVAIEDSLILALPGRAFLQLLSQHPPIAVKVMTRLARIVRAADERIMDLSTLGAHSRVHAEIARQARRHMTNGNVARIEPVPLHNDIASRVSTTRETVARVLNDLARQGIVKRTKDALLVQDVSRLQRMVEDVRG